MQVTEVGADAAASAAARAGVYVLTQDYLAICVNEDAAGTDPKPVATAPQAKSR